jgi:hypothetical protein
MNVCGVVWLVARANPHRTDYVENSARTKRATVYIQIVCITAAQVLTIYYLSAVLWHVSQLSYRIILIVSDVLWVVVCVLSLLRLRKVRGRTLILILPFSFVCLVGWDG